MKIKNGKKWWLIANIILCIIYIIGIIYKLITTHDFDSFNLLIIFLLLSNIDNFLEKK